MSSQHTHNSTSTPSTPPHSSSSTIVGTLKLKSSRSKLRVKLDPVAAAKPEGKSKTSKCCCVYQPAWEFKGKDQPSCPNH
ncbi:hypothetical protein P9112_011512 [Eukaryota sp. TZLM1-RC]